MSDKLISADNLLEAGKNTSEFQQHLASVYDLECLVMGAPAVDAVEVVRCKDCKYKTSYFDSGKYVCKLWQCPVCGDARFIKDDGFCSYGERREENAVD